MPTTVARKPNTKSATIKENYAHNSITIITTQTTQNIRMMQVPTLIVYVYIVIMVKRGKECREKLFFSPNFKYYIKRCKIPLFFRK